ncbi:MAG: ATP-grasp domain-containing protein [Planctomyces sp.]|nr:ATP-grasp domain-containing protein [Planctomyces sp.]
MKRSKFLILEFLHADAQTWLDSSASMRQEAAAMLSAVIAELQLSGTFDVAVVLSENTALSFNTEIPSPENGNIGELRVPAGMSVHEFLQWTLSSTVGRRGADVVPADYVLIIAPETNQILCDLLLLFEALPSRSTTDSEQPLLLNLDAQRTAIFSDKWQTFEWLRSHNLPTIDSQLLPDFQAGSSQHADTSFEHTMYIIKPRDGAGSDGVRVVTLDELLQFRDSDVSRRMDYWLIQPLIEGVACSCGMIGRGPEKNAFVLPAARQLIQQTDNCLYYTGGVLPCGNDLQNVIQPVIQQIAQCLGGFRGYVGVDLIVNLQSETPVRIVEINPRLCTSFVGYRILSKQNLVHVLCGIETREQLDWHDGTVVKFDSTGTTSGQVSATEIQEIR